MQETSQEGVNWKSQTPEKEGNEAYPLVLLGVGVDSWKMISPSMTSLGCAYVTSGTGRYPAEESWSSWP